MVEAGTLLQNRYLIEKQIGAGGMGTVYVATDQRFNSPVAIKETLFDEDYLQHAFEREAQLLNSLRHPVLPHVIDYFAENGRQYLVMEYFAGQDLSETLKQAGAFSVDKVLFWTDNLLDALDYLHSQKTPVVHRDIKPQNLKLTARGEIILLDFGLAKGKLGGEASQISRTHSVFGYSRNYAPLEQIQGTGTDTRSDIYSLGATIYHLLTGKPPIDALTRATAFVNNQPDPLVPANVFNSKIPIAVANTIGQALNLNPDLRPQTAVQMRVELRNAVSKTEIADAENTKISATAERFSNLGAAANAFTAESVQTGDSHNFAVSTAPNNYLIENPFEQPASNFVGNAAEKRQSFSLEKSLTIAAAILILGGGCFAAWYATVRQRSKDFAPAANSNSVVTNPPVIKPSAANESAKSDEKIFEKSEEKNSNAKVGINTVAIKSTELSNKTTTAAKAAVAELTHEETPASRKPALPIIVRSAPRVENSQQINEINDEASVSRKKSAQSEPSDSEDPIDALRKQKKINNQSDAERIEKIERRERRVSPDKRRRQKLPTLLGAPQR